MTRSCKAVRFRALTPILALLAALAGCTPAAKPYAAANTPPPTDPVRQRAEVECAERATRATENVSPQSEASKAAVGIYFECMKEKGYPPQRRDGAPPGGPS